VRDLRVIVSTGQRFRECAYRIPHGAQGIVGVKYGQPIALGEWLGHSGECLNQNGIQRGSPLSH
jgi:hypothetical protein